MKRTLVLTIVAFLFMPSIRLVEGVSDKKLAGNYIGSAEEEQSRKLELYVPDPVELHPVVQRTPEKVKGDRHKRSHGDSSM